MRNAIAIACLIDAANRFLQNPFVQLLIMLAIYKQG
jgi:hypothetical protein